MVSNQNAPAQAPPALAIPPVKDGLRFLRQT